MIACRRVVVSAALVTVVLCATAIDAAAQRCQPRRALPRIVLTTLGACEFNPDTLSFAGDGPQQARCLMRSANERRNLGPQLESLPSALAIRVGQPSPLPDREALATHLAELGLTFDYAPFLWQPLSRARDNDPDAPQARYFVIHDTSGPNFGRRPFPVNIDEHRGINNLGRHRCSDGWESAHVIINRAGAMLLGHEFNEPWRATRFERATRFGNDLKGLFLHVELVQPRRSQPGRGRRNDALAPTPGFSDIQYDRLALIYTIASVRAGRWLIPAFHVAIDSGIRGGHDDPQNFEVAAFGASIERLGQRLDQTAGMLVAETPIEPPADLPVAERQAQPVAATPTVGEQPTRAAEAAAGAPPGTSSPEEIVVAEQPEPPLPQHPVAAVTEAATAHAETTDSTVATAPPPADQVTPSRDPAQTTVAQAATDQITSDQGASDLIGSAHPLQNVIGPAAGPQAAEPTIDGASQHRSIIASLKFVPELFLLFPLAWVIFSTRGRDKHGPASRDGRV